MNAMLEMKDATKIIRNPLDEDAVILDKINVTINQGDFVTVLGGNGAGKSTLFNSIAGSLPLTAGTITLAEQDITSWGEEKRAQLISRVFQDPKMGTAPRMTVAENLLLALNRGKRRKFIIRKLRSNKEQFERLCRLVGNGLEHHLDTPTGNLSGGQRQSLSLLMATITNPQLLLLDEHTAALDPKVSKRLMQLTEERVQEKELTCLMITHRMEDALRYGNRLLVMEKGKIKMDLNKEEKERLTLDDLMHVFEEKERMVLYTK